MKCRQKKCFIGLGISIFCLLFVIILGALPPVIVAIITPICYQLYFETASPTTVNLPEFNSSRVEVHLTDSFSAVYQDLPNENKFNVCITGSLVPNPLPCLQFTYNQTICCPLDHELCLPAAFVSNPASFGLSILDALTNATGYYILDAASNEPYFKRLSQSSDLDGIWYDGLGCTGAAIIVAVLCPSLIVVALLIECLTFISLQKRKKCISNSLEEVSLLYMSMKWEDVRCIISISDEEIDGIALTHSLSDMESAVVASLVPVPRSFITLGRDAFGSPARRRSLSDMSLPGDIIIGRDLRSDGERPARRHSYSGMSIICRLISSSEERLLELCWIPFGVKIATFGENGGRYDLETHLLLPARGTFDEDHITLEFPSNAVDPGTTVHVRYAIIADGPFRVPTGYRFGSMVVYLVVDGARLKRPMMLHLPHWLTCVPSNRSLVKCLRAPHSLKTGEDSYTFSLLNEGHYNISDTASTIQVDGDNCLFAVAHEEGIKERYQYQVFEKESLEKQEKEVCIYITFFTLTWLQIVNKYCKRDWRPRETPYRTSFSISDGSNALGAAVSPASEGRFWSVVVDGINSIPIQLFDFTSELAIGNAPSLKSAVKHHLYPPAFTYRVVQNEAGRDSRPKKRFVYLDLSPTQPAVKIPVDVIDYESPDIEPHPAPYGNELSLPSLKHHIVPTVAAKWESFGTFLGVEHACLQKVKRNHCMDCGRACEEMLKLWLTKDTGTGDRPRTWATVIDALEEEGYRTQAQALRDRLLK